jgi:hypothetical protein
MTTFMIQGAPGASAQAPGTPATSTTPDGRSTTFQPVEGGPEQHSGTTLLVEAYVILWVILMAWLLFTWRRQKAVGARLEGLEQAIDRAASKLEKSAGKK